MKKVRKPMNTSASVQAVDSAYFAHHVFQK